MDKRINLYRGCQAYRRAQVVLRLLRAQDSTALYAVYPNPAAVAPGNDDFCGNDLCITAPADMEALVAFWLAETARGVSVRFVVEANGAIGGTIAFYKRAQTSALGCVGVLCTDLAAWAETEALISDLLSIVTAHFYQDFGVDAIYVKAAPAATQLRGALLRAGFQPAQGLLSPFHTPDYFVQCQTSVEWIENPPAQEIQFVAVAACEKEQWLFRRNRACVTWEIPGGGRRANETPENAACRVLQEKTGAFGFTLSFAGYYQVRRAGETGIGALFCAQVRCRETPALEKAADVCALLHIPAALTYPDVDPLLLKFAQKVISI